MNLCSLIDQRIVGVLGSPYSYRFSVIASQYKSTLMNTSNNWSNPSSGIASALCFCERIFFPYARPTTVGNCVITNRKMTGRHNTYPHHPISTKSFNEHCFGYFGSMIDSYPYKQSTDGFLMCTVSLALQVSVIVYSLYFSVCSHNCIFLLSLIQGLPDPYRASVVDHVHSTVDTVLAGGWLTSHTHCLQYLEALGENFTLGELALWKQLPLG